MSRPRLETEVRRDAQLRVRLTAGELAALQAEAAQTGIAFPDFVRQRALTGRVVVDRGRTLDAETWRELRRIGVNLNQIARFLNGTPGPVAPPLLASVRRCTEQLTSLLQLEAEDDQASDCETLA